MPWDPTVESLVVAIHAALTPSSPTGEIVYFEGFFTDEEGHSEEAGRSFLYDCASGAVTELITDPDPVGGKNLFCAGHANLADGRWLVAGGWAIEAGIVAAHGHGHGGTGIRDCFLFLPRARTWRKAAEMHTQPNSDVRGGGRWYPTLVTLGNGHVLAIGGHPRAGDDDLADDYPTPGSRRHSNNIPERYSPGLNAWMELTTELSAPDGSLDEYDRLHLAPSGHVFFSTIAKSHNDTRLYDPYTGTFATSGYGSHLDEDYDDADCSSRTTSIILPILHTDLNRFWILACGAAQAERIDLRADEPDWLEAGERQEFPDNEAPPVRRHLLGILLPTGQVFVSNGMRSDNTGVQSPEIYTPAIDWSTGQYTSGGGSWDTLTNDDEQAVVPRGYHSVALLQPDGSVWTAGSTHTGADLTNPNSATRETRIAVYRPIYGGGRPEIEAAPDCVDYGESFSIRMGDNDEMQRVVMIRCGSFTHAFDGDQRYLTLPFSQDGDTLRATAPSSSNLAPPGYYLLWVLRTATTPCERARFIRLAPLDHYAVLQLSTYSLLAVKALRPPYTDNDEGVFAEAIELFYVGFLPLELNIPSDVPDLSWEFAGGGNVPGMRIELNRQDNEVDPVDHPDTAQQFRFVYDVIFENEDAFDTFDDDESRNVEVRANLNGRSLSILLTLMKKANPFMKDGNPAWLSTDLRIHKARVGDVNAVGGPQAYIQGLLDAFENSPVADDADSHPFALLDDSQDENPVVLAVPRDDDGIFNFAIARVRYLSVPDENAEGVKVFFRLFNTVGTALEYNSQTTYRMLDGVAGTIPGLGIQVWPITSIPFFAAPRVTPDQAMTEQHDNIVNRKTLFGKGPELEYRYFGVWLDVNTFEEHFPRFPKDDGPYGEDLFPDLVEGPPQEMVQLIAGYHQCLVAEINYQDDPIQPGQTPFTTDNLAQRNLATVSVANPGLEDITRTAQTSVDIKPSDTPTQTLLQPAIGPGSSVPSQRFRADTLVFSRNTLPVGTIVELYLPDVSIDEVLALSTLRHGPSVLERVDEHTLRFAMGPARYVALPGRNFNIAGLLSVTLPLGIKSGELYRLTVKQYSGRTLRFVGAFDLAIPVKDKGDILPGEIDKLAILRYVFTAMPKKDRWYPVFERYLYEIGERVRGFGGDPDSVEPSAHGSDTHDHGEDDTMDEACPGVDCVTGKICDVEYDCFGDFEAFTLDDCCGGRRRIAGAKDLERVVLMAWRERPRVTVCYRTEREAHACVNAVCYCSGTPVARDAVAEFEGVKIGFCGLAHRDTFARALACVVKTSTPATGAPNAVCPFCSRPVVRDALVDLPSGSVGFCSRAHRDRFLLAVNYFREVVRGLETANVTPSHPIPQAGPGHGPHGPEQAPEHQHGPGHEHEPGHHHDAAETAVQGRPQRNKAGRRPDPHRTVPSINRNCPWTGKRVSAAALTCFEGHVVGFQTPEDRDAFERAAIIACAGSSVSAKSSGHHDAGHHHGEHTGAHATATSATCASCASPASPSHMVSLHNGSVGFCGAAHRDEFLRAVTFFRDCAKGAHAKPGTVAKLVRLVMHC